MSLLFGWVPRDQGAETALVLASMLAALRVDEAQQVVLTPIAGVGVGVLEPPPLDGKAEDLDPVGTEDGRFMLWMVGEAVASGDPLLPLGDVAESRTRAFRRALLSRWLDLGAATIAQLDGEFQIAIWDARDRELTLVNDRFGGLPLYCASSDEGIAFGGGVRGVLMAPGVPSTPDEEALREAMTFGGFRLGDRTNVAAIRMVPGGSVVTIRPGGCRTTRYWSWRDIPLSKRQDARELVEELRRLWRGAIGRRLVGGGRFGQTLSGGLDSRAILAEAAPRAPRGWTAITYGLPGCDDARYAECAARAAGARWSFYRLYGGENPDWLDRRTAFIQQTDGLIELGDLMHIEALELQRSCFDVHLSGYVGDAVSGPTFASVATTEDAVLSMPYYGAPVSLPYDAAVERVAGHVKDLGGAPVRFLLFEHKLPQSTNRWTAAWRPWLRVRKPFLDYAFFDFCQGLPIEARTTGRLQERWLRTAYPECFASIPNQKTGVPVLTSRWRYELARVARRARAAAAAALPAGWRPMPRVRSYHDNGRVWREPAATDRLLAPMLAPDSLTGEILGRTRVANLLRAWRTTAAAPAQVIGAMYVYESYHRHLTATLGRARLEARTAPSVVPSFR